MHGLFWQIKTHIQELLVLYQGVFFAVVFHKTEMSFHIHWNEYLLTS